MSARLRIMVRVVRRRVARGEVLEDVLASYPNLSEEDKATIRGAV